MRILCLIMVGAFLLTIAIAENGDSQRVNDKPQASMKVGRSMSQSMNVPWSWHRASDNGPVHASSNNIAVADSVASPAISAARYYHREHRKAPASDGSMILEPMHSHRSSSPEWMDWIPDFFDDDPPPSGRGPLIGPIDFPGLSRKLFIRQHQPLDEDTEHVVIHVVNRQAKPSYSSAVPSVPHPQISQNQIPYYDKNPSQLPASYYTNPVKIPEYDYDNAQLSYKLVEENPWKLQSQSSSEPDIKDKQSQYPFFDAPSDLSNGKNQFSTYSAHSKPSGHHQSSISWSQRYDGEPLIIDSQGQYQSRQSYERSVGESKGPVKFPAMNNSSEIPSTIREQQSYSWLRKYGYQNSTKAASENVRSASAILRAKLAEISSSNNRRQQQANRISSSNVSSRVSRTSDASSSRQPRNRFSHFDRIHHTPATTTTTTTTTSTTQRSPVYVHKPLDLGLRTSEVSFRQSRKHRSQLDELIDPQRSPVYIPKPSATEADGAFEVVQAPALDKEVNGSTGEKTDEVMQNIMEMTASQRWKNISSNVIQADRRSDSVDDDKEQTKEKTTSTSTTSTTTSTTAATTTTTTVAPTTTNKSKPEMQEAIEKMMGSFSQWRYKVVSTSVLKELGIEEAKQSKKER